MKISDTLYAELSAAIKASGGLKAGATMRERWDGLWRSKFNVSRLYNAGLNDNHIDTALRHLAEDIAQAAFEDECFRSWLNRIDARIEYDTRRALGTVTFWRWYFDHGKSEGEAIADAKEQADNRAYCSGV